MAFDLVQIRRKAEEKDDENNRFRLFLKSKCHLKAEEIDERVFAATRRIWAGIDCTECANCCKKVKPGFSEEEVDRLARRLAMSRQRFIETYLELSEPYSDNPWTTRTTPCPFLKDNRCSVYEDRPADCSGYPYLYKSDFVFRTRGMIERALTCPLVYEVMDELKKSLGFLRWRS
jgi:Fe-S-cluster containining protein